MALARQRGCDPDDGRRGDRPAGRHAVRAACGPQCDPHGYVAIFSIIPVAGVVGITLIALTLLIGRKKSGFGTSLGASACCAVLVLMFSDLLAGPVRWSIVAAVVLAAALAIAGLRVVPAPRRLPDPPYPSLET